MTTLPPEDHDGQAAAQHDAGEAAAQPTPPQPESTASEQPAAAVPPPAAPQYQAPPAGAYQQPQQGYQQPQAADPVSSITLNYWLSVFFTWLPALIFWIIEKDKGNQRAMEFHVANLNFSLVRTGVVIAGWIIGMVPYIGWILGLLIWVASVVLFVFHIMAAAKAPDAYRKGGHPEFVFNLPIIK
ncbi:DUF4870 domain-containing protein [Leucobacter sp. W1478]|uniref:DUF4870 domain-containing protein n=1 Tax=Leucobacter sp. W1478 TaxID=3439065 RepID=UPI003F34CF68